MNLIVFSSGLLTVICLIAEGNCLERGSSYLENRVVKNGEKRISERKREEMKVEEKEGSKNNFAHFLINYGTIFGVLNRTINEYSNRNVSKAELFNDQEFRKVFIQWIQEEAHRQKNIFGHKEFPFYEYLTYAVDYAYDVFNIIEACEIEDVVVSHDDPLPTTTITTTFTSSISNTTFTTTHSFISSEEKKYILEQIEELKMSILDPRILDPSKEKGFEKLAKNVLVLLMKALMRCMDLDTELYDHLAYFINLL